MYCPNCGQKVVDDDKFCSNCGFNLKDELVEELEAVKIENTPVAGKALSDNNIEGESNSKAINYSEQVIKLNPTAINYQELANKLTDIEDISIGYLKLLNSIIINKEDLAQKVDDVIKEIQDHKKRELNLVVAGEFSRGKSTFINALLGEALLPVNIKPTTAKLTILKYGDKIKVDVVFADGKHKEINPKDLEKYVAEYGDSKNEVKEIRVLINSPFLKNGINLIDTPGVNVTLEEHLNITKRALSVSDIIIFLLASDSPVKRTEIEFLKANCADLQRVFFVLNMIDKVDEEEREEVIEYAKSSIVKALKLNKWNINFYAVSALKSLEERMKGGDRNKWGYDKLEAGLANFSEFQKNKLAMHNLLQFISKETNAFKNELENIFTPTKERASEIDEEIQQLVKKLSNKILPENEHLLNITYSEIRTILNEKRKKLKYNVKKEIKNYLKENYSKLQSGDEKKIIEIILVIVEENLESITNETRNQLNKILERIRNSIDKELGSFITLIDRNKIKNYITFNDDINSLISPLIRNISLEEVNSFEDLFEWGIQKLDNFLDKIFETDETWAANMILKYNSLIDKVIEKGLFHIGNNFENSYTKITANIEKN